ncbi:uncharacterized protein B0T23DRAFT_25630 [Neurospora hispaniola]|uniref:Uncharacterized protein n=1 Tax=Neurospora hispaniola TaxID=588809 RepID=A0AAJ0IGA3_9PEZI|nr:hypothetical protein B0T23DRAFT_25630 [Neurospora hispaniola]
MIQYTAPLSTMEIQQREQHDTTLARIVSVMPYVRHLEKVESRPDETRFATTTRPPGVRKQAIVSHSYPLKGMIGQWVCTRFQSNVERGAASAARRTKGAPPPPGFCRPGPVSIHRSNGQIGRTRGMEWMSGGDSPEWACAGLLLVNRFLLGRLFAPTKNQQLHDILTCSTYVVDPSTLRSYLVRFSAVVKGKGVQFICFEEIRSSGWMRPAEAD